MEEFREKVLNTINGELEWRNRLLATRISGMKVMVKSLKECLQSVANMTLAKYDGSIVFTPTTLRLYDIDMSDLINKRDELISDIERGQKVIVESIQKNNELEEELKLLTKLLTS